MADTQDSPRYRDTQSYAGSRRSAAPDEPVEARGPSDATAPVSRAAPDAPKPAAEPDPAGAQTIQQPEPANPQTKPAGRNKLRLFFMLAGIFIAVIGAGAFWLRGGRWVSTDNAYIRAPKLMVSTDVSGIVSSVEVKEGERVTEGQILFRIDPQQFEIAVRVADAQVAQTKIALQAGEQDYKRLQNDILAQAAQADLAKTVNDRAATLLQTNAGTRAAYDQAHFSLIAAQKQLESLRGQAQAALIRLGGAVDFPVEQHPQYLIVKAQADEARRQLEHTIVHAPFTGVVTAVDNLQPGTFLVSQTAALTNTGAVGLIATDSIWIDANVKETDLTFARIGDPVEATIDAYPGRIWRGHVSSIAPASGAEFSILPAQNSSGNWVKVVQRVPVRIALDAMQNAPALRAGMSVVAEIDTGHLRTLADLWSGLPHFLTGGKNVDGAH